MRSRYSQKFKDEAVALALSSDLPLSHIARDLGVNYQRFSNWTRIAMSEQDETTPNKKPNKQSYQNLKRHVKSLIYANDKLNF